MLFSVENPHDGKTFENYTRFEWGVEVGVVTTFMLRLFVPHEFDMCNFGKWKYANDLQIYEMENQMQNRNL